MPLQHNNIMLINIFQKKRYLLTFFLILIKRVSNLIDISFFKKNKKKLLLFQIREKYSFFISILHLREFHDNFSCSLFKKYIYIFFGIANSFYFDNNKTYNQLSKKIISKLQSYRNFYDKKNNYLGFSNSSHYIWEEILKNFILKFKNLLSTKLFLKHIFLRFYITYINQFIPVKFSKNKKKNFKFLLLDNYRVEPFIQKFWVHFNQKTTCNNFFQFEGRSISSFEDLFFSFEIYSLKNKIIATNKFNPSILIRFLVDLKRKKKKFKLNKFLVKVRKTEMLKKILIQSDLNLIGIEKKAHTFFKIALSISQFLIFPRFKGQKILLQTFQQSLNFLFELEQWTVKLSSVGILKIFTINIRSSRNISNYNLFLFKILQFIYILKKKLLKFLFMIEEQLDKFHIKTGFPYNEFKKHNVLSKAILGLFNGLTFKKEIVHFIGLKIIRIILKMVAEMDRKIIFSKKNFKIGLFHTKNGNDINDKIFFLERLNNWQKIFEFRYNYLFISSLDLKPKIPNSSFIQFNEFSSRRVGF